MIGGPALGKLHPFEMYQIYIIENTKTSWENRS